MKHHHPPLADPTHPLHTSDDGHNPWLGFRNEKNFFEDDEIATLVQRGLFYARAGVPIHFQGTAGRGKTAIALEIAKRLGRTVSVLTGNDWLNTEDLIGRQVGQSTQSLVDKYVQRVRRSETYTRYNWEDAILSEAMLQGHTLVYDEFTRSNAKANGILLSVLEEGALVHPDPLSDRALIQAHPNCRIILTSNPHDYAGVNRSPDALLDRMVTFQMAQYSRKTEAGIVQARSGVPQALAVKIVTLVHQFMTDERVCSMRAAILIAKIAAMRLRSAKLSDALLSQIAADVLNGRGIHVTTGQIAKELQDTQTKWVAS